MKHQITIVSTKLSDGSLVWAVEIGQTSVDCVSEKDALKLAEKLVAAFDAHAV